jgi:hypothetical protein
MRTTMALMKATILNIALALEVSLFLALLFLPDASVLTGTYGLVLRGSQFQI